MTHEVEALARIIWDYHLLGHPLKKADCILVLGSDDPRVATYAADLYLQGYAPLLIFSGGIGRLTQGKFSENEADVFSRAALERGVPKESMLIENTSTNSGENIEFTKKLLKEKGLDFGSFILVQMPYMERRAYAAFKKMWPEKSCIVTSPPLSFDEYFNDDFPKDAIVHAVVGDLQRVKMYPALGYQIAQEIPPEVWSAYETLVELGYTNQLVK